MGETSENGETILVVSYEEYIHNSYISKLYKIIFRE